MADKRSGMVTVEAGLGKATRELLETMTESALADECALSLATIRRYSAQRDDGMLPVSDKRGAVPLRTHAEFVARLSRVYKRRTGKEPGIAVGE